MINPKDWIKQCEGINLHLYKDTVDKTTIGYGRNIQDNGISQEEADFMFENDFSRCEKDLKKFSWYLNQSTNVQSALINMCFNLGINRLTGFRKMITALINKDYETASKEALDSKWANQVGQRAKDVAIVLSQG